MPTLRLTPEWSRSTLWWTVAVIYFGMSLMERPIEDLVFRKICRSKLQVTVSPYIDVFECKDGSVLQDFEHYKLLKSVSEALGALIFSYLGCRLSDVVGRKVPFILHFSIWGLFQGVHFYLLQTMRLKLSLIFAAGIGAGRSMAQGTVFAMVTDLSNDRNRYANHSSVISSGTAGYLIGQLLTRQAGEFLSFNVAFICGFVFAYLGAIFLCLLTQNTAQNQVERYREPQAPIPNPLPPLRQVFCAFSPRVSRKHLYLLVITAAATPVASATVNVVNRLMRIVFTEKIILNSYNNLWLCHLLVALCTMQAAVFLDHLPVQNAQNAQRGPIKRNFFFILLSACMASWGAIGMIFASAKYIILLFVVGSMSACILSHGGALLMSLLGPRIRSKFAGRVFGLVQTLQSVMTLAILPPTEILSRKASTTRSGVYAWNCFAASLLLLFWFKLPVENNEPAPPPDEIELDNLQSAGDRQTPNLPPPAYSPVERP